MHPRLVFLWLGIQQILALLPDDLESQVALRIKDDEFEKYAKDHRKFAYLELKNGARAYVVSDKKAASALVHVGFGVGRAADPDDAQGIAHLLEHCALDDAEGTHIVAVTNHTVSNSNAGTSIWSTVYFLEPDPQELQMAVPLMVATLQNPLYGMETIETELSRVNIEYTTRQDDFLFVYVQSAYFGNRSAVRTEPEKLDNLPFAELYRRIREFQSRYYTADRAAMLLVGHESISELEALAVKQLSKLEGNSGEDVLDLREKVRGEKWIPKEKLGKQIFYASKSKNAEEVLIFIFPVFEGKQQFRLAGELMQGILRETCFQPMYINGPTDYHGEGFLYVESGVFRGDADEIQRIGNEVFSVIHFLRQQEPPVWWADDRVRAFESRKQTKSEGFPLDTGVIFDRRFRVREFPLAQQKPVPFNAEEWRAFLDIFDVDKMIVMARGERWREKCDKQLDRDAGVWGVEELNAEWKKSWQSHLDGEEKIPGYDDIVMPPRQNFLSISWNVKPLDPSVSSASEDDDVPVKVPVADGISDKLDLYWWQPRDRKSSKSAIYLKLSLPHLDGNPRDFEETRKFCGIYNAAFSRLAGASSHDWKVSLVAYPEGAIDVGVSAEADVMSELFRVALSFLTAARVTTDESMSEPTDNPRLSLIGSLYESGETEFLVAQTANAVLEMMKRYNMTVVPAAKSQEYFQGLVDGTVTPPAPPNIFSRAHVQMVAGGNLQQVEAQRFAADVVEILGIKEGCPPAPRRRQGSPTFEDLLDENGKPLRIQLKMRSSRNSRAGSTVSVVDIPLGEDSEELRAVGEVANEFLRHIVRTYLTNPGVGAMPEPLSYVMGAGIVASGDTVCLHIPVKSSFHPDKITQHIPQMLETVMSRVDKQAGEEWFERRKLCLLTQLRREYSEESTEGKTWRFFQQVIDRKPFIAMKMAEAGLRKLTFARYKEVMRSYKSCPWFLAQIGAARRAGKQRDYPSQLSADASGSNWISIGGGGKWKKLNFVRRHFGTIKRRTFSSPRARR